ncbi:MAG: hypothetical protein ACWA44_12945 [Thiotrichales bacterium]
MDLADLSTDDAIRYLDETNNVSQSIASDHVGFFSIGIDAEDVQAVATTHADDQYMLAILGDPVDVVDVEFSDAPSGFSETPLYSSIEHNGNTYSIFESNDGSTLLAIESDLSVI